ncbi:MAG: PaaI family thioesterase [Anaerolineaceae bacterium]|nr:PaaI family thioesterase [Anaerolineaceae bacterium]
MIKQSSTHHCFVCGIENPHGLHIDFTSDGEGRAYAEHVFPKEFEGYPGIVHGGVISSVLDEAAGRATMRDKRPEFVLVTGKLVVHFRQPVRIGEKVLIEGKQEKQAGRIFLTTSCLKNEAGEVLAEAEVTLVQPGKELTESIDPAEDQWVDFD